MDSTPPLASLAGVPAPAHWTAAWSRFAAMSADARGAMRELVTAVVAREGAGRIGECARAAGAATGLAEDDLQELAGTLLELLDRAAARDLDAASFTADLAALGCDDPPAAAWYTELADRLRLRLLESSILDHTRLLAGIDWRIDRVEASHRAEKLDLPLVHLTFTLRSADGSDERRERLTFSALPQSVTFVRSVLQEIEKTLLAAAESERS